MTRKKNGKIDSSFDDLRLGTIKTGNRYLLRMNATEQHYLIDTDIEDDASPDRLLAILEEIYRDTTLLRNMRKLG